MVRLRTDSPQRPARILRLEILEGVLCADEGDADLHQHLAILCRVERHVGAAAGAGTVGGTRQRARVAPRPGRRERPVEEGDEMEGVGGAGPAELPTRHLALDLLVAQHLHACSGHGVAAVRHLEQDVGFGPGWEGEARDSRARCHREGHGDGSLLSELDPVLPRRCVLVMVREARDRRGGRGDGAYGRQYRDVLIRRAPRSAQVGQAEAVDLGVVVRVATPGLHRVRAGVRAPLDHAEGDVRPGELAHGARADRSGPSAVERTDEGRRVGAGGRGRRCSRSGRRKTGSERRAQGAQRGKQRRGEHECAASTGTDRAGHRHDRSNGECGVEARPGSES